MICKALQKKINITLLFRIYRYLGADFDIEKFDHYPFYDPVSGIAFSYLTSLTDQTGTIAGAQDFYYVNFLLSIRKRIEICQKRSVEIDKKVE